MANLSTRDSTATDIRIRAAVTFLIIQTIIAWCSTYSSAVTSLTAILKYHTAIDGIILISTFVMSATFSFIASIISLISWLLDGATLFLMFQAISKCFDIYQTKACFSTIPQDIISLGLLILVCVFDFFQYYSLSSLKDMLYLRAQPAVEQHILQRRARLLHLWSFPFACGILLTEIILAVDTSTADALASTIYAHIALDLILAYTATQNKPALLHIIGLILTMMLFGGDIWNLVNLGKVTTTYLAYKEWCLYTLLTFDLFAIGVRLLIATYKPEVITMLTANANKAKWQIKRILNPTIANKKDT